MDFKVAQHIVEACERAGYVMRLIDFINLRYSYTNRNKKHLLFDMLIKKYKLYNGFIFFDADDSMSKTFIALHTAYKVSSNGTNKEAMYNFLK